MWTRKGFLAAGGALVVAGCGGEDDEERAREARAAADLEIVRFLLFVERVSTSFWEQVVQRSALPEGAGATLARYAREQPAGRSASQPLAKLRPSCAIAVTGPARPSSSGAYLRRLLPRSNNQALMAPPAR